MSRDRIHLLDKDGKYACIKACGKAPEDRATTNEKNVDCWNCLRKLNIKTGLNLPKTTNGHKVTMKRGKEPLIYIDNVAYRPKKMTQIKIDGDIHDDEVIYEVAKTETDDKLDFIRDQIKRKINTNDVLDEILRPMTTQQIDKMYKILKDKKPKITKQKGCLGIKIDGGKHNSAYIQVFE